MTKTRLLSHCFGTFEHSDFGFVSDFGFRDSNLRFINLVYNCPEGATSSERCLGRGISTTGSIVSFFLLIVSSSIDCSQLFSKGDRWAIEILQYGVKGLSCMVLL